MFHFINPLISLIYFRYWPASIAHGMVVASEKDIFQKPAAVPCGLMRP